MKDAHHLQCEAPICHGDPNPNYKKEVIWWPGELVCQKRPYEKFQKKQVDINKLVAGGVFKNIDEPYTANELETRAI